MIQHNDPVVLPAPYFELVFGRFSEYLAGIVKDFLFDRGRVQEIHAWDLAFVDKGTVGHCEKGGGVESVAVYRCALRQVLSSVPVPFGCFDTS